MLLSNPNFQEDGFVSLQIQQIRVMNFPFIYIAQDAGLKGITILSGTEIHNVSKQLESLSLKPTRRPCFRRLLTVLPHFCDHFHQFWCLLSLIRHGYNCKNITPFEYIF